MITKIKKILQKKNKSKIISLTAYSKNIAKILDNYCDIILVGDSMANVLYAQKNTQKKKIKKIIEHSASVRQGVKRSLLVVDMPKGTYENVRTAEKNARLVIKSTSCDAIKLESNKKNYKIIKALVEKNIPIMGHIGFTPQFKKKFKDRKDNFCCCFQTSSFNISSAIIDKTLSINFSVSKTSKNKQRVLLAKISSNVIAISFRIAHKI